MSDRNFLGIPIEGTVNAGDKPVAQRPIEEFQPIVQAVLDDPTIQALQWTQYTPYFNDGDPCTFSAHGLHVLPEGVKDDTQDDDYEYSNAEESESWISASFIYGERAEAFLGKAEYHWEGAWPDRTKVFDSYKGPDQARFERVVALNAALEGGAFDHVLLELFGDHATITVNREKIVVNEYSHD